MRFRVGLYLGWMQFLITFNPGHCAHCPHALFHLNWTRSSPFACGFSELYMHIFRDDGLLSRGKKKKIPKVQYSSSEKCMMGPMIIVPKNNWNAARFTNNVSDQLIVNRVKEEKEDLEEIRWSLTVFFFFFSSGCRWREIRIHYMQTCCATHSQDPTGVCVCVMCSWMIHLNQYN